MKYFLTIIIIVCSFYGFSQNTKTISEKRKHAQLLKANSISNNSMSLKTLNLNLMGVPKNNQGALKDDFLDYEKKIISLEYDEFNELMTIKYSELSDAKIAFLLDKHGVDNSAITVNE